MEWSESGIKGGSGWSGDASDDLLRRCSRGDSAALSELVRCYKDRIFRLAFRMLGDPSAAEEAAARTFTKLWTRAGQWRGEARAGTWIYRVAVRTILDVRRHERRWNSIPILRLRLLRDPRPCPAAQTERREVEERRNALIQTALSRLREEDRALVHLFYFEGRSLGEIEVILGVPRANLKMRLARARDKLRILLGGDDGVR